MIRQILTYATLIGLGVALCWRIDGVASVQKAGLDAVRSMAMILPHLALGLTIAGLMSVLVPRDRIARLLGRDSGPRGIVIATCVGSILPGGPFTSFPLVHALAEAGAAAGPLVAFLIAWAAIGINRLLIWEIPFMGSHFAVLRCVSSVPLPIIAGLIASQLDRRFSQSDGGGS